MSQRTDPGGGVKRGLQPARDKRGNRRATLKDARDTIVRMMINRALSTVLLLVTIAAPAAAQQAAPQGPPTATGFLRNLYNGNKNNVLRVADRMPEEFYGMRPGTQEEVRTFGQHVAHIAHFNYLWCSQAKGEANPNAGRALEKELKTKAEFVKAVTAAFAVLRPGVRGADGCLGRRGPHHHAGERQQAATDPRWAC